MSINKRSFITGLLYMALAVIGPIGFLLLPSMITPEAFNYSSVDTWMIALWFFVEVLMIGTEIFLTVYLWKLMNEHHKTLSLIAFIFRIIMVVVMVVNSIFLLSVVFSDSTNAHVFLPMHVTWVYIWQLSFSVHVAIIGYMVLKYLKTWWRYLGVALMLGALGYCIDSLNHLILWDIDFLTTAATILLYAVTIGEIGMAVALLMKKVVSDKLQIRT